MELIVVLLVGAVLAGAVVPSLLSAARRSKGEPTAARLAEMLEFAGTSAIMRRSPVTVNLDPARRLCWVSVQGLSLPWLEESEAMDGRTLIATRLPEGVEISFERGESRVAGSGRGGGWETIPFRADGTAEDVRIGVTDLRGRSWTIQVVGVTGEVRLTEEE